MAGQKFKDQHPEAKKTEIYEEMLKMNNVGVWQGKNVMGKILKACSICLIKKIELPINIRQLYDKNIFLLGKQLTFGYSYLTRFINTFGK